MGDLIGVSVVVDELDDAARSQLPPVSALLRAAELPEDLPGTSPGR